MSDNTSQYTETEEWRPISGLEGLYEVSSFGRVRSLPRTITRRNGKLLYINGGILTANPNSRGYPRVTMYHCGKSIWATIHSLVASTFLTPPPQKIGSRRGEYNVNHIDGNKCNNHVRNLEYITNLENIKHARKHGLLDVRGSRNAHAKLTATDIVEIRRLYDQGSLQVDLAEQFGVNQTTISCIVLKKTWKHIT